MSAAPTKKGSKPASKPAGTKAVPKKDKDGGSGFKSKPKRQCSFRLPDDAFDILAAVAENKAQHRMTKEEFVARAIRKYGKEVLGDAMPALRHAPAEYVDERLKYLERLVIAPKWAEFLESEEKQIIVRDLIAMIQTLGFEPHAVDMENANAWRKKRAYVKTKTNTYARDDVVLVAYAYKLGLIPKDESERDKEKTKTGKRRKTAYDPWEP